MRPAIVAALLVLAAASPAAAERDTLLEQSQRDLDASGLRSLRVENDRGSVEVAPSADGRVHVRAYKQVRAVGEDRARLARETVVETDRQGDALVVRVRYPGGHALRISILELMAGWETPRVEVRLALEIPPSLAVDLRSASGDLRTSGLDGPESLWSTSGSIRIDGARGRVTAVTTSGEIQADGLEAARLTTVSGDVTVRRVRGALEAHSTSGGITVEGAAGSLALRSTSGDLSVRGAPRGLDGGTMSGDISVREADGMVAVSSSSGRIEAIAGRGLQRIRASSASGDITLELPERTGAALDLQTVSGTLDVQMPMDLRTATRHQVRGTVGRGGASVALTSTSGDIHVTAGGNGS